MNPESLNPTRQPFNGHNYYLCGRYFSRPTYPGREYLHRMVWIHHNGEIPEKMDVHHLDGNASNNSYENLALMHESEHHSLHMMTPKRKEQAREAVKKAILAAPEWHASPEGLVWHKEHGKRTWDNAEYRTLICAECGKEYQTRARETKSKFCGLNCKMKQFRERHPGYRSQFKKSSASKTLG